MKFKFSKTACFFVLLYVIFYWLHQPFFKDYLFSYTLSTLILLVACSAHYSSIVNGRNKYFKIFVFYILNIAYFIKFYAMIDVVSVDENILYKLVLMSPRLDPYLNVKNLSQTFLYSSLMYASCVSAFLINDSLLKFKTISPVNVLVKSRALYFSLFVTVFTSLSTTILRLKFADTSLEPLFIILNTYFVPLMFCFLITFSIYYTRNNKRPTSRTFISVSKVFSFVFVICGLFQFYLIGSKLFVILPILFVLCISLNNNQKIIPAKLFLFLPLALLIYPALNMYREALLGGVENPLIAAFNSWWNVDISFVRLAYYSILYRFIGADSVSVLLSARDSLYSSSSFIDILFGSNSVAYILTYDILNYEFTMGAATSIFGQVYFIFGNIYASCLFIFVSFVLIDKYIYILINSRSVFYRGLGAYLFIFTILYINEGVIFTTLKYQLFAFFVYFLYALLFIKKRISNDK